MSDYDPNVLGAAETGWEEGYDAAVTHTNGGPVPRNPYTKLREDRIAYVREQIREEFGPLNEDDDLVILPDDLLDALLDSHADWLAVRGNVTEQVRAYVQRIEEQWWVYSAQGLNVQAIIDDLVAILDGDGGESK